MFTVKDLAEYLRVHPSTVYRLLRTNQLPGFRIGSDWRFNIEVIDKWCTREGAAASKGARGRRKRASNE
ncbi:MAG TPA: helix-turn-helix domain-containing protein [Candidatus Binataceae bacterium]|nr:helix-turn-helix domain-containing protein [Candidatus Binataceae bacterium]